MRSAPCPFLLHFFFVKRQNQTALSFWWSLDMTRSTTELLQIGLEATTFALIRQMLSVAFEAVEVFWPVCGSLCPVALRIVTVNQAISGRSFFVHFPRFLKFLAPRLKKIQILQCGWVVRRMIAKSAVAILRRTSHCGETARFLPPFFWRYTTPRLTTDTRQLIDWGMFVDARSKMFRQHLKCSLTEKLHQDVQEQAPDFFFVSFYSASCLTLGVLVQRFLGQPVDLLARHDLQRLWYLANCRLLFIFRSVERRVLRNLEGLANVCLDELTVARRHWLFFFQCLHGEGEVSERGETKFSAGVTETAPTTMHAEERQRECSQRHSEGRAGRLSDRFRLRAYRTVQTRPVSSRSVHAWGFPRRLL